MQFKTLIPMLAGFVAMASASSLQVNFYSDTGCQNYIGHEYIDYSGAGTYSSGGPAGSRGGIYVNGAVSFRGFSNSYKGSPFTGNVALGECIGSTGGLYAVFDV